MAMLTNRSLKVALRTAKFTGKFFRRRVWDKNIKCILSADEVLFIVDGLPNPRIKLKIEDIINDDWDIGTRVKEK